MNLEEFLPYTVNRCAFSVRQRLIEAIKVQGISLTPEEGTILNQLWLNDKQTQSQLAEFVFKGPSTVTRQIDSLVKKQLVTRVICENDRRKVYACLTPQGKKLKLKLIPMAEDFLNDITQNISPADLETTLRTLNLLRENAHIVKKGQR
jgi:DNA-binding MarR family transcriptional regulator